MTTGDSYSGSNQPTASVRPSLNYYTALGASATAIAVARALLGHAPDFRVEPLAYVGAQTWPSLVVLGAVAGIAASLYNCTLLGTLTATDRLSRWPVELRAGVIGAAVGILGWFAPGLVGGGDEITQHMLAGGATLAMMPLAFVFLLRFGLGAVSYAAATPGGLFAPILVLGAQLGLFSGTLCRLVFPDFDIDPIAFAVVGMAALFHRCGSGSDYRHHSGHRDDRELYDASTDARRMFCGDAGGEPTAQRADLRFTSGADSSTSRTGKSLIDHYSSGKCTSKK